MDNEYERRLDSIARLQNNKSLQMLERERCERSKVYFVNNWMWTYDPRTEDKHLPFILYPFQEDSLSWIDERYANQEIGVIEKTRDMGITWIVTVWALHQFLFVPGFSALFGSRAEMLVDDNSVDSIFGKLRYNLYKLPQFLVPNMRIPIKKGRKTIEPDTKLSLINTTNENEMTGQSANKNFARGGRRSIVFIDEYAFVDQSDSIWKAVSQVANCIIPLSTAHGKGNMFYILRSNKNIPRLTLHRKLHPNKTDEWYAKQETFMEPHQLAQEINIDYLASKAGRVYKRASRDHHLSTSIIYPNQYLEHFITWDFGIADLMVMIVGQIDAEDNVEIYAEYTKIDQDIEFFLPMAVGNRPFNEYWNLLSKKDQTEIYDFLEKVYRDPNTGETLHHTFNHYGDFAGTQRQANSRRSVRNRMANAPYNINLICNPRQDFANRIQCFDNLLKLRQVRGDKMRSRFTISPDCTYTIDCLFNYIWESEDVNKPNIKPRHDEFSHGASALEFMAINRFPVTKSKRSTMEQIR